MIMNINTYNIDCIIIMFDPGSIRHIVFLLKFQDVKHAGRSRASASLSKRHTQPNRSIDAKQICMFTYLEVYAIALSQLFRPKEEEESWGQGYR